MDTLDTDRRTLLKALGAGAVGTGLAGCVQAPDAENYPPTETSDGPAPAEYAEVKLENYAFEPAVAWVKEGSTVTWTGETPSHTATAYHPDNDNPLRIPEGAKSWDSDFVEEGGTYEHTFDTEGVFDYVCTPHEGMGMVGTIVVGYPELEGQPGMSDPYEQLDDAPAEKLAELNKEVEALLGGGDPHADHDHSEERDAKETTIDRIAADPTDIPGPIDYDEPRHHDITLTVEEHTAEIEDGVTFDYMTFGGQIPGPMIRVREGDKVTLTLENMPDNEYEHNVDSHAIYGPGGGAADTVVLPGEDATIEVSTEYPGAFIYHCAVPNAPMHISSGMYGLMVVEPKEGLPQVDREFYLGQNEVYTDMETGEEGHHMFDFDSMMDTEPSYVLLNGQEYALTGDHAMEAELGETVRVFMGTGGPDITSDFHPIGNVWSRAWPNGSIDPETDPDHNVQTMAVPPGSAFVGEMDLAVPGPIKLVDHSLTNTFHKGSLAILNVNGDENEEVYDSDPL